MSRLFIRTGSPLKITQVEEMDNVLSGLIGDYTTWSDKMRNHLLKLLEDPSITIDVYSSEDINDNVLLSRFCEVIKGDREVERVNITDVVDRHFRRLYEHLHKN